MELRSTAFNINKDKQLSNSPAQIDLSTGIRKMLTETFSSTASYVVELQGYIHKTSLLRAAGATTS
jgi:hypothetical protein